MKRNHKKELEILKHRAVILEIDLAKAKRARDECKRQKNEWRNAAQKLVALILTQKQIPRWAKRLIKNFPKC